MSSLYTLDEPTKYKVENLSGLNIEGVRGGACIVSFQKVGDTNPGDLTLDDKLVLAKGVLFDPNTGRVYLRQYSGNIAGEAVIATLRGVLRNSQSYNQNEVALLSVTLDDGSTHYVKKREGFIKYSEMFAIDGTILPEFVDRVKASYEKKLKEAIENEEEVRTQLQGITENEDLHVDDEHLEIASLNYRLIDALNRQLNELAFSVTLPKAPDMERDLDLTIIDGSLWNNVFPLGVDALTGLTSFFHVIKTIYEPNGQVLTGIEVELCRIITVSTVRENVSVYQIEKGEMVVLKPEQLRPQITGKRYDFSQLASVVGYLYSERPRQLVRDARRVYVTALCRKLGKK